MRNRWITGLPLALLAAQAAAQVVAVPPAEYHPRAFLKAEISPALLTSGPAAYTITLPPPTAMETRSSSKAAATSSSALGGPGKGAPLQIGFSRPLPDGGRPLYLSSLKWQSVADGGHAARVDVTSPGAAALRLALNTALTDPDVSFRFAESAGLRQVYGPYPANKAAASKPYWSPVLEGDTATLEIYLPPDVDPSSVQVSIPQLSHLVRAGADLLKGEPTSDIGASESCEVDLKCVATAENVNQGKAVAKMVFTVDGGTFACTGTLVNDSIVSNTPYFFTANHCMNSQQAASNLFTYWFFDAIACHDLSVPPYKTVAGGAVLLGRSVDSDWALVRLNAPPPAGAVFSAWRADPIVLPSPVTVVHHPEGDLKKVSQGTALDPLSFSDGTSFTEVSYTQGSTEPGSSGSGLLTLAAGGPYYELRGGLFAGTASCTMKTATDVYSRFDVAFPLVKQYLAPNTSNPSGKTLVVEYYAASLDDYFITADKSEINGLDNGAHPGWVRTGLTFLAYSDPMLAPPGAHAVCRFYVAPQFGDSHFYSADQSECAATAMQYAGQWIEESPALFYIQLPDNTGACPANTRPIYRFVNLSKPIHHRYTAEVDVRNCMYNGSSPSDKPVDCIGYTGNWLEEGYGSPPAASVMCGPAS